MEQRADEAVAQQTPTVGEALAASSSAGLVGTKAAEVEANNVQVLDEAAEADPARERAEERAFCTRLRVTYYEDAKQLFEFMRKEVVPGQKVLIFVDACTSKARIIGALLYAAVLLCKPLQAMNADNAAIALMASVGRRLDILSYVDAQLHSKFPNMAHFIVLLSHGQVQSSRKLPRYLRLSATTSAIPASASVPALVDW